MTTAARPLRAARRSPDARTPAFVSAHLAAAVALCVVTVSCSTTTSGRVVGAPNLGHAPRPVPTSALSGLLLSTSEAGDIMGARLAVADSSQGLYENQPLDDGCLVWAEAQRHTYQDSGWTAVRVQELRDRPDANADHIVYQSVVAFPDAAGAHAFYEGQQSEWKRCDDRRVDLHDPGDPDAHYWSLNTAVEDEGILTITRSEEDLPGWSCQRAMTAKNNVIVDLSACAMGVDDRGARLTERIAAKIDDQ